MPDTRQTHRHADIHTHKAKQKAKSTAAAFAVTPPDYKSQVSCALRRIFGPALTNPPETGPVCTRRRWIAQWLMAWAPDVPPEPQPLEDGIRATQRSFASPTEVRYPFLQLGGLRHVGVKWLAQGHMLMAMTEASSLLVTHPDSIQISIFKFINPANLLILRKYTAYKKFWFYSVYLITHLSRHVAGSPGCLETPWTRSFFFFCIIALV